MAIPMGSDSGRMLGSGCGGLILHTIKSALFLIWLLLALVVQLVTVSMFCVGTTKTTTLLSVVYDLTCYIQPTDTAASSTDATILLLALACILRGMLLNLPLEVQHRKPSC